MKRRPRQVCFILSFSLAVCCLLVGSFAVQAATFTVNTNVDVTDPNTDDGVCDIAPPFHVCTLRAAIEQANALAGAHEIILPPNAYVLTLVAPLIIRRSLTITGGGASTTIIDGNSLLRPDSRVLTINPAITVNLTGITIVNG